MYNLDKDVSMCIVKAQICSEIGKCSYRTYNILKSKYGENYMFDVLKYKRYRSKEYYIRKALRIIASRKDSGFSFSVQEKLTNAGRESLLVYFNFKINGMREQISFHTFDFERIGKFKSESHNTRWLKNKERDSAVRLFEAVF